MLLSKCAVCRKKMSGFIKNQKLYEAVFNKFNNIEMISLK